MKKLGIIVFVVCVVVGLCFANFFSFGRLTDRFFNFKIDVGNKLSGSGKVTSEKRDVGGFSSIEVNGIFQVDVVSGKDFSVEVQADDNIFPIIKTNVGGTVLHIDLDQKVSSKNDMIVRVSMPNIEKVESSAASKVTVTDIKNDSFSLNTSGASKVSLAGQTAHLNIDVSGASNVDAEQLIAVRADLAASGASKIAVNVSDELHSEATGASRITYVGDPKTVDSHQTGVGSISKK